jgi:hypothetical protein
MSYSEAFDFVSKFYTQKTHFGKASTSFKSGLYFDTVHPLRVLKHCRKVDG